MAPFQQISICCLCALALLTVSTVTNAIEWQASPAIEKLFTEADITGTFVVYDLEKNTFTSHNQARAQKRFVPASTFKIPNTLIGLSAGAVQNVDEVLPYGGKPQPFEAWEHDMPLREAIALSAVPIYQELARRITLPRMAENVRKLNYGNADIGTTIDTFWLVGPLKISAVEQTQFLAKLAQGNLPYPADMQQQAREIVLLEQGDDWALYGKTGWVNAPDPGVGWWVGWVVRDGQTYTFALNIDILSKADADKRIGLGKRSLQELGILPGQ